jgi:iron complex transport system ATP-binding protein
MIPKTPLLIIKNLSAGYTSKVLFENLDLILQRGQLVCFMGPNGSGKSTLIRTLAGLQKPLNGNVETAINKSFSKPNTELISLVLTDSVRASYMTVYDLVTFGRYPYLDWRLNLGDHDKVLIDLAIEQVNIADLKNRRLNELSDGQRQMAMIAKALAQDTPIIILDEPTAHLDLNNRVEIMKLLKRLTRKTHKAILMATHELDLALQMADSIWLAGHEKTIITGIPEDLVLRGMFDDIFKFKGFDLKTGKVQHEAYRLKQIGLTGDGHYFLWTKNLLERNGFTVGSQQDISITILAKSENVKWIVNGSNEFESLQHLITYLESDSDVEK